MVFKGYWKHIGIMVAVKTLINTVGTSIEEQEEFRKEAKLLSEFRHDRIVRMFGYCHINGMLCMVKERSSHLRR